MNVLCFFWGESKMEILWSLKVVGLVAGVFHFMSYSDLWTFFRFFPVVLAACVGCCRYLKSIVAKLCFKTFSPFRLLSVVVWKRKHGANFFRHLSLQRKKKTKPRNQDRHCRKTKKSRTKPTPFRKQDQQKSRTSQLQSKTKKYTNKIKQTCSPLLRLRVLLEKKKHF